MDRVEFHKSIASFRQLPALADVVARALSALRRQGSEAAGVASWIALEPCLCVHVLSVAAAGGYGDLPAPTDIEEACNRIGPDGMRDVVLAAALSIVAAETPQDERALGACRHAVACACLARAIATRTKRCSPDQAYTAGLVHDIGAAALAHVAPELCERTRAIAKDKGLRLMEAEREAIGIDHALAGKWLAEHWRLAGPIVDAIWLHHHPPSRLEHMGYAGTVADVVNLADALSRPAEDGTLRPPNGLPQGQLRRLGLSEEDLQQALQETAEAVEAAAKRVLLRPQEPGQRRAVLAEGIAELLGARAEAAAEYAAAQKHTQRLEALHEMNLRLRPGLPLPEVLAETAAAARHGLGIGAGVCCAVDTDDRYLYAKTWQEKDAPMRDLVVDLDRDAAEDAADDVILQALRRLGLGKTPKGWAGAQKRDVVVRGALVAVPLSYAGRSYGQLVFDAAACGLNLSGDWSDLRAFAGACGSALARCHADQVRMKQAEDFASALSQETAAAPQPSHHEFERTALELVLAFANAVERPLDAISNQARVLLDRAADRNEIEAVGAIAQHARRAQRQVADLQTLMAPPHLKVEPTLINYVLHQLLAASKERLEERRIRIIERYAEGLPRVLIDRRHFERALTNLVLHAEECMPHGGVMTLETGALPDRKSVVARITHTGPTSVPGLSDRLPDAVLGTERGQTTDLGLAAARTTVRAHGGDLRVDSGPGQGVTFTIMLPAASEAAQPAPAAASPTILIVDRDESMREILAHTLRSRGYRVKTAQDGEGALQAISAGSVDLVLLEIPSPQDEGMAALREIRARRASVPVIAITGPGSPDEAQEVLRGGAHHCLAKPFKIAHLLAEVEGAVLKRSA